MIIPGLIAVASVATIGLGWMAILWYRDRSASAYSGRRISWSEYSAAMAVVSLVVMPLVMFIGSKMSVNAQLTDYELWHGTEAATMQYPTQCVPGHSGTDEQAGQSNCDYQYDTGQSYSWTTKDCYDVGTGSNKHQVCDTIYHSADIYAPYATVEWRYAVLDSFGGTTHVTYTYPGAYLSTNPIPYYSGHAIPASIPRGAPADWLAAKAHLAAGDPRSTTKMFSYENPIFATHDTDYLQYSANVQRYLRQHILPYPTANILTDPVYGTSRGLTNEVSFVGVKPPNEAAWQSAAMRFNAALGLKLQGDLHVVVIKSSLVDDPHEYLNALKAYWQSEKYFGHRPISKNVVMVVIGTADGKTIDWAQASTGMPYGNNVMLQAIQNDLPGKALSPDVVFGAPRTVVTLAKKEGAKDKVTVTLSNPPGVLSDVMFKTFPFARACMIHCPNGQVGYGSLIAQIQPSAWDDFWMILVISGVSLPFWWYVGASDRFDVGRHVRKIRSTATNLGWRNYS